MPGSTAGRAQFQPGDPVVGQPADFFQPAQNFHIDAFYIGGAGLLRGATCLSRFIAERNGRWGPPGRSPSHVCGGRRPPSFTSGEPARRDGASYVVPLAFLRRHFNASHSIVRRALAFRCAVPAAMARTQACA